MSGGGGGIAAVIICPSPVTNHFVCDISLTTGPAIGYSWPSRSQHAAPAHKTHPNSTGIHQVFIAYTKYGYTRLDPRPSIVDKTIRRPCGRSTATHRQSLASQAI